MGHPQHQRGAMPGDTVAADNLCTQNMTHAAGGAKHQTPSQGQRQLFILAEEQLVLTVGQTHELLLLSGLTLRIWSFLSHSRDVTSTIHSPALI